LENRGLLPVRPDLQSGCQIKLTLDSLIKKKPCISARL
jgi:hypothetical protein